MHYYLTIALVTSLSVGCDNQEPYEFDYPGGFENSYGVLVQLSEGTLDNLSITETNKWTKKLVGDWSNYLGISEDEVSQAILGVLIIADETDTVECGESDRAVGCAWQQGHQINLSATQPHSTFRRIYLHELSHFILWGQGVDVTQHHDIMRKLGIN